MREYVLRKDALTGSTFEALRDRLLSSPLVGRSTLAGSFRHSRGFALTFTRDGVAALEQRFPELAPFLARVLEDETALASFGQRVLRRAPHPRPNAFYVNVLLIGDGGEVGRHTDATLRGPSGDERVLPVRVSVLYLRTPPSMRGGALSLYRGSRRVGVIHPREGALLHFRGDLLHEVGRTEGLGVEAVRASLVCEQYALEPEALARVPSLQVQSRAGFAAYLDSHARGGQR